MRVAATLWHGPSDPRLGTLIEKRHGAALVQETERIVADMDAWLKLLVDTEEQNFMQRAEQIAQTDPTGENVWTALAAHCRSIGVRAQGQGAPAAAISHSCEKSMTELRAMQSKGISDFHRWLSDVLRYVAKREEAELQYVHYLMLVAVSLYALARLVEGSRTWKDATIDQVLTTLIENWHWFRQTPFAKLVSPDVERNISNVLLTIYQAMHENTGSSVVHLLGLGGLPFVVLLEKIMERFDGQFKAALADTRHNVHAREQLRAFLPSYQTEFETVKRLAAGKKGWNTATLVPLLTLLTNLFARFNAGEEAELREYGQVLLAASEHAPPTPVGATIAASPHESAPLHISPAAELGDRGAMPGGTLAPVISTQAVQSSENPETHHPDAQGSRGDKKQDWKAVNSNNMMKMRKSVEDWAHRTAQTKNVKDTNQARQSERRTHDLQAIIQIGQQNKRLFSEIVLEKKQAYLESCTGMMRPLRSNRCSQEALQLMDFDQALRALNIAAPARSGTPENKAKALEAALEVQERQTEYCERTNEPCSEANERLREFYRNVFAQNRQQEQAASDQAWTQQCQVALETGQQETSECAQKRRRGNILADIAAQSLENKETYCKTHKQKASQQQACDESALEAERKRLFAARHEILKTQVGALCSRAPEDAKCANTEELLNSNIMKSKDDAWIERLTKDTVINLEHCRTNSRQFTEDFNCVAEESISQALANRSLQDTSDEALRKNAHANATTNCTRARNLFGSLGNWNSHHTSQTMRCNIALRAIKRLGPAARENASATETGLAARNYAKALKIAAQQKARTGQAGRAAPPARQ